MVITMELIAEIRRRHFVGGESISALSRSVGLSRPTVRKHLMTTTPPIYSRAVKPGRRLGCFEDRLLEWLETEKRKPARERRTAQRLYEGLREEGYEGAYDSVQRYVRRWKRNNPSGATASGTGIKAAFVPLAFSPGEACQFDWSHERAEIGGIVQTVKVAHFRLSHSRQCFVAGYPRERQEMVFDAHDRAFAFFGGVPARMIYDNLKPVVDLICVGKERQFNHRFLALANHYLFEPVACTPASGWEKGQVENQVGNLREWLFTPMVRFASFDDLNAWLSVRCVELGARKHPTHGEQTIAECFEREKQDLRPVRAAFDGYVEQMMRASSTCLVRVDRNRYSVPADFAGKIVSVRTSATRIKVVADNREIADHPREFGRDQLACDPWHYLPVLERKPGALRNGIPFREWDLPKAIRTVRDHILSQSRGDRAFVELLQVASQHGLEALDSACQLAMNAGTLSAGVVMNELRRLVEPPRLPVNDPQAEEYNDRLRLTIEPLANCARYDMLLGGAHAY